jgi:hypothetical protein
LENTLSLFPVRQDSWHSVGEVVSGDYLEVSKQRLSLNGWFFCDSLPTYPNPKPEAINTKMLTFSSEIEVVHFCLAFIYSSVL